eukprot:gene8664-9596_t
MGEREKSAANGFLKVWKCGSQQEMLTFVILDILRLLKELQKECQRNMVVMPDIILKKEQTIQSFDLMLDGPYPGGEEEKHLRELQSYDVDVHNEPKDEISQIQMFQPKEEITMPYVMNLFSLQKAYG